MYVLNLIDESTGGLPLLLVGLFECIALQWVYGRFIFLFFIYFLDTVFKNVYINPKYIAWKFFIGCLPDQYSLPPLTLLFCIFKFYYVLYQINIFIEITRRFSHTLCCCNIKVLIGH